ncbi:hypothetical protein BGZ80_010471 [Entomortierella chlamydospora]|uniref:Lysosomal dipeptide transporter MFSD1 n=1 Tax=Entomortierella chlamydospora TaxID=101097 RepID=A0A9P6T002_9FUNG|nr:hypothetical protein BGZ80_010471 [Entomortierella chlamydospora]
MTLSSAALEEEDEAEKENEMAEDDQMRYSEIFTLKTTFWILSLCCISLYGAVVPFIHVSSDFLQKKWYLNDPTKAGAVMSIPDLVSSIGSPLCGYIVDRFGGRARYIPLSAILLIWAHAQLGFTMVIPVPAMLVLGLAYSLFASVLWPCIPFLVKDHQLGTAYGLVTIALNISLTFFPMLVASILDSTNGSYVHVEGLFVCLAIIGLLFSILLNVLDYRQGGHLQLTEGCSSPQSQDHDEDEVHEQRELYSRQDYYNPREPGFEYRRKRRYSQNIFAEEDPDIEDVQNMVTTKPVGEGIIAVIPHRRRHSMAGFAGQTERARLSYYAHHAQGAPSLNEIAGSMSQEPPSYLSTRIASTALDRMEE